MLHCRLQNLTFIFLPSFRIPVRSSLLPCITEPSPCIKNMSRIQQQAPHTYITIIAYIPTFTPRSQTSKVMFRPPMTYRTLASTTPSFITFRHVFGGQVFPLLRSNHPVLQIFHTSFLKTISSSLLLRFIQLSLFTLRTNFINMVPSPRQNIFPLHHQLITFQADFKSNLPLTIESAVLFKPSIGRFSKPVSHFSLNLQAVVSPRPPQSVAPLNP